MRAFKSQEMEIILNQLAPLFYKNLSGVSIEHKEDIYQELTLTCMKVVNDFDFSQSYEFA